MSSLASAADSSVPQIAQRVAGLDWRTITASLDERGYATTGTLLTPEECSALARSYTDSERFRSRILMRRHGYGEGEYQYFAYPLPRLVAEFRRETYRHLVAIANRWRRQLDLGAPFPEDLESYLALCHQAGQSRPTPLILKYEAGDYNRLHRDLYGELVFPIQMAVLLSQPGRDFDGGEFILTEQRPRMQSRAEVVPLEEGQAVLFAVNLRPAEGQRGYYRLTMRHGVSRLRWGQRHCLGIIFHDAQ